MKETYIIKIWETEEERDAGLSEIISSNIADLKTAIQDAKKRSYAIFIIGAYRILVKFDIFPYEFNYYGKGGGR